MPLLNPVVSYLDAQQQKRNATIKFLQEQNQMKDFLRLQSMEYKPFVHNNFLIDTVKQAMYKEWNRCGFSNEDVKCLIKKGALEKAGNVLKYITAPIDLATSTMPNLVNFLTVNAPLLAFSVPAIGGALAYVLAHPDVNTQKSFEKRRDLITEELMRAKGYA
jgi:hypothetical protein